MLTSSIDNTGGICFLAEKTWFDFEATITNFVSPNYKVYAQYFLVGQNTPFLEQRFTVDSTGKAKIFFNAILSSHFNSFKFVPPITNSSQLVPNFLYKIVVKEQLINEQNTEEIDNIKVLNGTVFTISSDLWTAGKFLNSPFRVTNPNSVEYLYLFGAENTYSLEGTLYFSDRTQENVIFSQVNVKDLTLIPVHYNALDLGSYETADKKVESYQVRINGLEADFQISNAHPYYVIYLNELGLWETLTFRFVEKKIKKNQSTFESEDGIQISSLDYNRPYFCQSPAYTEYKALMKDFFKTKIAFVEFDGIFRSVIIETEEDTLEMDSPDFEPNFNFSFILSK